MPNNSTNHSAYLERIVGERPFGWTFRDLDNEDSFAFERLDPYFWQILGELTLPLCPILGALYIYTIFSLRKYMENRPPFQLKTQLFLWNFCLGIFSIFGFIRMLPGFLDVLSQPGGFYSSICKKEHLNFQTIFWSTAFTVSKLIELGDTVFIVMRKRPLVFIQWYHHLITMTVTWIVAPYVEPITRWLTVLNYGVHSFMYPYFALKGIGVPIPSFIANCITTMQLAQMILGFTVNILSMYYQHAGYDCVRYPISVNLFIVVYGSFIVLFGKLFYDAVIKQGRRMREKMSHVEKID